LLTTELSATSYVFGLGPKGHVVWSCMKLTLRLRQAYAGKLAVETVTIITTRKIIAKEFSYIYRYIAFDRRENDEELARRIVFGSIPVHQARYIYS
jgi:hypothetical protein